MDLQKLISKAEAEIAQKHQEADAMTAEAKDLLSKGRRKVTELNQREAELAKFKAEIDKKISRLEGLEEIKRSDRDRAILKQEADDLMEKAKDMMEKAQDKKVEADRADQLATDRELKIKDNAKNYKQKLKEAAISNLLEAMFKGV